MTRYGANSLGEPEAVSGLHPKWRAPTAVPVDQQDVLRINNTLTGRMDEFIPQKGRQVRWYNCGPTVYDVSHMGHARTYLTFDIIRRIMEDYFNLDVVFQTNITDVDDKIILRSRCNELVRRYKEAKHPFEKVTADVQSAVDAMHKGLEQKVVTLTAEVAALKADKNAKPMAEQAAADALLGEEYKLNTMIETTLPTLQVALASKDADKVVEAGNDALAKVLDAELGHSITDHSIFDAHARFFEADFFADMDLLGVRPPDVLTRVTEYVPQIITFVEKIIGKDMAYSSNGSVYIDLAKFKTEYDYRKLSPSNEDTSERDLAESEGALGGADASEKRNKNDFALWKASKPGEPAWDSPWGQGRPGWHIECSVVASDILGQSLDIHTGGVDLKFPHHDNELAQAEACFGTQQWVNYFLHTGHLHIKGLKMSKSLKNMTTIKEALKVYSARQMRILFLLQPWDKNMNFSDKTIDDARKKESTFKHFFGNVKALQREDWMAGTVGWRTLGVAGPEPGMPVTSDADKALDPSLALSRELAENFLVCTDTVHKSLLNNFDTYAAMHAMLDAISFANEYMRAHPRPSVLLLLRIARYITKILRVFGVVTGQDDIGLDGSASGAEADQAAVAGKYLDVLASFRGDVRSIARDKAKTMGDVLAACDVVRDSDLIKVGVRLEDRSGQPSVWSLDSPEVLLREQEERFAKDKEVVMNKIKNKVAAMEKELIKVKQASVPASALFVGATDKYSAFDDAGMPTLTVDGKELTKGMNKAVKKEMDKHAKVVADVVKKSEVDGSVDAYVARLTDDMAALQAQLKD